MCVYMHWEREREREIKREREVCFALLTLYKLDSGTSGTSQRKASFEETSVLASLTLSSSPSLGIQSPSVCHH